MLENCWHVPFPIEKIIETLDNQVKPSNVDAVKPLEIDPQVPVYKQDKTNEKDFRYIGNAMCGTRKCLAYLMDMLAQAETYLRKEFPDDNGWLVIDDFHFDFRKANKLIVNAMKLFSIANIQTGQARHDMLKPKFNADFQMLWDPEHPFTQENSLVITSIMPLPSSSLSTRFKTKLSLSIKHKADHQTEVGENSGTADLLPTHLNLSLLLYRPLFYNKPWPLQHNFR